MGKSAPQAPTPPDPKETAAAQTASNQETARTNATLNRVNQYTPYGSLTYQNLGNQWLDQAAAQAAKENEGNPGFDINAWKESANRTNPYLDQWSATQQLSDAGQRQLDMTNQAADIYGQAALNQLSQAKDQLSQQFNPNLPELRSQADFSQLGDPNVARDEVAKALYGRLNPQLEASRLSLENRLRNQGLAPGSEAWTNAIRDATQTENDARLAVETRAGQEQSRLYGLGVTAANLQNAARGQSLQEQFALRNQPINEASALLSGQQITQPTFTNVPTATVAPTDVIGATNSSAALAQQAYQSQLQAYNSGLSGLYGLAGSGIGLLTGGLGSGLFGLGGGTGKVAGNGGVKL